MRSMILLIDNYDSFVHNLARYFRRLGQATTVVRNDAISVDEVRALGPRAVILSPGPCTPREAGCSLELVRQLSGEIPLLGVCLGHQTIGAALGAEVARADVAMHGRASTLTHGQSGLLAGLPSPLTVGRYHSLVLAPDSLPSCLEVVAQTEEGTVMAVAHREHPTWGVQFHPESVLTEGGMVLLANFLRLAGLDVAASGGENTEVLAAPLAGPHARPVTPVGW